MKAEFHGGPRFVVVSGRRECSSTVVVQVFTMDRHEGGGGRLACIGVVCVCVLAGGVPEAQSGVGPRGVIFVGRKRSPLESEIVAVILLRV
jgi:hypothetical protein